MTMLESELVEEVLIIACPSCGGTVVQQRRVYSHAIVCPPPSPVIRCRDCGAVLSEMTSVRRKGTDERVKRGDAPLRTVVWMDPGMEGDGLGMLFTLECGHTIRLQRRHYRYEQKMLRCFHCRDEG